MRKLNQPGVFGGWEKIGSLRGFKPPVNKPFRSPQSSRTVAPDQISAPGLKKLLILPNSSPELPLTISVSGSERRKILP